MTAQSTAVSPSEVIAAPDTAGLVGGLLRWNMPQGVTQTSQHAYDMHMMVLWVCTLIALVVFASMAWVIVRYRASQGAVASGVHANLWVEGIWTLVPALILIAMAVPTTRALLDIERRSAAPAVTVRVTGLQWKWSYGYPDLGISFDSNLKSDSQDASRKGAERAPDTVPHYLSDVDRPLVLPVGVPVRLQIGSADVIHSWWVPDLGFKRDAIPGFINTIDIEIDRPGIYRGQCAELCGAGHAYMPVVVQALSKSDFDVWVATERKRQEDERAAAAVRPWTLAEAIAQGSAIYETACSACHQKDGKGLPGAFPALDGSAIATGPIEEHLRIVIHGSQKNPIMRAFGPELDDRQLAGVITYERNSWGNTTGDLVTPEAVRAAR